jgi:hypothetical protein
VVGVFLVCWVPFFCANIAEAFCKCVPKTTFQVLTWIGYFNSTLNPIIYSIFNTEFRYAFHKIIAHRCPWLLCSCCDACCPDRNGKSRRGTGGTLGPGNYDEDGGQYHAARRMQVWEHANRVITTRF